MKTLTLLMLLFTGTTLLADELLIFKRLSDDIGTREFPIPHIVWQVDALTYGTERLLKQANAVARSGSVIEGQQHLEEAFHQVDPSLWVALWAITFAAREKMARYGLHQVPSAVWLDDSGAVIQRYPLITHVDQIHFDITREKNMVPHTGRLQ